MDWSTVGAALATGLLSGGGAGYIVSIYTARKESEDRKEALRLERDKFQHEKDKWDAQRAESNQKYRLAKLDETELLLQLVNSLFGRLPTIYDDAFVTDDETQSLLDTTQAATNRAGLLNIELVYLGYTELSRSVIRVMDVLAAAIGKKGVKPKARTKFSDLHSDAQIELTRVRMELTGYGVPLTEIEFPDIAD